MSKVALITGGTTGLGAAICHRLAGDGFTVIANYLPTTHAQALHWQEESKAEGHNIALAAADVSDAQSCQAMVEQLIKDTGSIDILVNNAGIIRDASIAKMSVEQWKAVIDTNLSSLFNLCKPIVETMREKQFGRIVNLSSINAQRGQFGQTNYCAAKAGVHGFTKALAQETARNGITVNTVSPGIIQTSMIDSIPQDILDGFIASIPVGRVGLPADIAQAVRFLVDENTGYITGAQLPINGGLYMS